MFTPAFVRSPRLSDFLLYICKECEEGREHEISEHNIGVAVFGRSEDYDSTIDSIVRSHATRLRQKLRDYFNAEGVHEPVMLTVPKGSYIPRFEARLDLDGSHQEDSELIATQDADLKRQIEKLYLERQMHTAQVQQQAVEVQIAGEDTLRKIVKRLWLTVIVLAVVSVCLTLLLWRLSPSSISRSTHPLWSNFFDPPHGRVLIVESDSGLVMLQHLTQRPVSLDEYMSGKYLGNTTSSSIAPELTVKFASKRYTPVIDTEIYNRISQLLKGRDENVTLSYARDVRLEELKRGNAFLMGSHESNPWVSLYEPSMNFHFHGNLLNGFATIVNQHPKLGELQEYSMSDHDPEQTVYGHIAYRPSLDHVGSVLIVEGLTVAGTQTAADFLFNDERLLPFLRSITGEGKAVPHFEVILRSNTIRGQSSRNEVVAYRVETD